MHVNRYSPLMGTDVEIAVAAGDPAAGEAADRAALAAIEDLSAVLSGHDQTSELCRWRRGELDAPSAELAAVLAAAEEWHRRSGGAFHPASAGLRRLWLEAEATQRVPDPARARGLADAVRELPYRTVRTAAGVVVERLAPCTGVDLDAIAKGHIVDRAVAAALAIEGVDAVVVNAGGDLRHAGTGCAGVTVDDPREDHDNAPGLTRIELADAALATSGQRRRGFRIGAVRYGHVIDPGTGWPVAQTLSATVRAGTTAIADAVATAALAMSPQRAITFVDSLPGEMACLLVTATGPPWLASARWPPVAPSRYHLANASAPASTPTGGAPQGV